MGSPMVMGARLLGMGEEGWSTGGSGVLWRVGEEGWFHGGSGALWRVGEKGWFDGGSCVLWRVGEEGWFHGGSGSLWWVREEGWSSVCWTRVGKSMSIVGKIPCNEGEDCVCDCWQNGKTLSWKMTSRLVKKVSASILYAFWLWG